MNRAQKHRQLLLGLLDIAADKFSSLGLFQLLSLPSLRNKASIYLLERLNILSGSTKEAIIIPAKENDHPEPIVDEAKEAWTPLADYQCIFIDCFSKFDGKHYPECEILTPEEIREKLLGIKELILSDLDSPLSLEVTNDKVLPRNLKVLSEKQGSGFIESPKGNALDYLMDWADNKSVLSEDGILLVGERGTGKTWLLREFANERNNAYKKDPLTILPAIYIDLAKYAKHLLFKQGIEKSLAYFLVSQVPSTAFRK